MNYRCKYCGKKGGLAILRNHYCGWRGKVSFDNDNDLLATLFAFDAFASSFDTPVEKESSFGGFGGGESGGGGASRGFDNYDREMDDQRETSSDSENSDSGSGSSSED